jgi:hypothetical protein
MGTMLIDYIYRTKLRVLVFASSCIVSCSNVDDSTTESVTSVSQAVVVGGAKLHKTQYSASREYATSTRRSCCVE